LNKTDHEIKRERLKSLLEDLHKLEAEQCELRKNVRTAHANREESLINSLSWLIYNNRRKPNGLRDLNKQVFNYWQ